MDHLPIQEDKAISEQTFIVNRLAPILHGTFKFDSRRLFIFQILTVAYRGDKELNMTGQMLRMDYMSLQEDKSISEMIFTVNHIAPVLHGCLKFDPRIAVHFKQPDRLKDPTCEISEVFGTAPAKKTIHRSASTG
ncbi:hypothetical protein BGZ49_007930, partial [Haplosporangium sp. Z 27]